MNRTVNGLEVLRDELYWAGIGQIMIRYIPTESSVVPTSAPNIRAETAPGKSKRRDIRGVLNKTIYETHVISHIILWSFSLPDDL